MTANLFVNRLCVLNANGCIAYDERFHHGINIIRGDNSSGKSTITRLLFYALGGDYVHFVPEARRCSRVMVEVEIDHAVITLSRPMDKDRDGRIRSQQGMTIHWGTLDKALAHSCESQTFGFRTLSDRSSFSNILFETMNMPIVQGDNNITMHQLLRLLYIDQESPTQSLFYFEQFDSQTTRETTADLLLGIFDSDLYEAKIKLKELDAKIAETKADIRAMEASLPKDQRSSDHINSLIASKNKEIIAIEEDMQKARRGEKLNSNDKSETERLKLSLRTLAHECDEAEEKLERLEHDIEDTQLFIDELTRKRYALQHSVSTREILGSLRLEYCPDCLSPLPHDVPEGVCRLCKSPVSPHSDITQAKRLISEITFQLKESQAILAQDLDQLDIAKSQSRSLHRKYKAARRSLDHILDTVRTSAAEKIEDLNYHKGLAQGDLIQYYTILERAAYYENLLKKRDDLLSERDRIDRLIKAKTAQQEQRRSVVMAKMQEHGVYFLHHDKECQRAFVDACASDLHVDFSNNMVYLQDQLNKYSASSAFFLKLVARFSLFFASLDIPWMRYPHFIFADNMEDKGIEEKRAQKFQQTLIDRLKLYPTDEYQVIYTTSYITEALDHSEYVVGDHYTMHNKSLKNV